MTAGLPRIARSFALIAAVSGALALGACHKGKTVVAENASVEDVAKKVGTANSLHLQPGRWEATYTIEKMEVSGMPPQMKEMMQRQMGAEHTIASCLTPEKAAKPAADFFNGGKSGCKFEHFMMGDGKIDAKMDCQRPQGTMTASVSGVYDDTSYTMHTSGESAMPGGKTMTIASSMTGHRVGECNGTENK